MSVDANALERETLERKDRDELQKIVGALGGKSTSRTRKADLIDQILELTGVTASSDADGAGGDAGEGDPPRAQAKAAAKGESAKDDKSTNESAKDDKAGKAKDDKPKDDKPKDDKPKADKPKADKPETGKAGDESAKDDSKSGASKDASSAGADDAKDQSGDGGDEQDGGGKRRRRRGRNREGGPQEEYTGEPIPVVGCLDLRDDGYGFLRVDGMLASKDDCYVSVKQVRQFGLRKGDVVAGGSRPAFRNEKNPAMLRIDTVNGVELEPGTDRPLFEELQVTFPTDQLTLTLDDEPEELATRAIDVLAPIGKGSRVLVAAPPRSGKTTLLQTLARSFEVNEPEAELFVVLVDERPEEIAEMESIVTGGTVYGAAFDAPADDQVALVELALSRVRRLAEAGTDVVVLFDGLTRYAKAAHTASNGVGRSLGGIDVAAIEAAKRVFGTGRNLADAGSVTLIATAAGGTTDPVDHAVLEALVSAASCQITLDGFAAIRQVFPALDVAGTTARHDDYIVGDEGAAQRAALRAQLTAADAELPTAHRPDNTVLLDNFLARLRDAGSNEELLAAAAEG